MIGGKEIPAAKKLRRNDSFEVEMTGVASLFQKTTRE